MNTLTKQLFFPDYRIVGYTLRLVLGATVVSVNTVAAAVPTLTEHVKGLDALRSIDFLANPGFAVRDAAAFEEMRAFVKSHYRGVVARHHFAYDDQNIVDCVDILTQPGAIRHNLTAATLKLAPANQAPNTGKLTDSKADPGVVLKDLSFDAYGNERRCAAGTVPLMRLDMKRLAHAATLAHFLTKSGDPTQPPTVFEAPGAGSNHEYAKAYQWIDNWGAETHINIWKPYVENSSEFSLSQLWVSGGWDSSSGVQTLEAGVQVSKGIYGDWDPHLFIYSTQNGYDKTGCYNTDCGDFVQVDNSVTLGARFSNISTWGGAQYSTHLWWQKDDDGWWLYKDGIYVGYYPSSLYNSSGVKNQASKIAFGGEIVNTSPSGRHTKTDWDRVANRRWAGSSQPINATSATSILPTLGKPPA